MRSIKLSRNYSELKVLPGGEINTGWISLSKKNLKLYMCINSQIICRDNKEGKHSARSQLTLDYALWYFAVEVTTLLLQALVARGGKYSPPIYSNKRQKLFFVSLQ